MNSKSVLAISSGSIRRTPSRVESSAGSHVYPFTSKLRDILLNDLCGIVGQDLFPAVGVS